MNERRTERLLAVGGELAEAMSEPETRDESPALRIDELEARLTPDEFVWPPAVNRQVGWGC
jgi:hypothetical protein